MANKFTNKDFDDRLVENHSDFKRIGEYISAKSKIEVQCKCGNIVLARASHLLNGEQKMCKQCANKKATNAMKKSNILTNEEIDKRLQDTQLKRIEDYKGLYIPILFECSCGRTQVIRPKTIFNGKSKCNYCIKQQNNNARYSNIKTKEEIQKIFDDNEIGFTVLEEYKNSDTPIKIQCNRCKAISNVLLYNVLKKEGLYKNTCKNCRYDYFKGENNPSYNKNLSDEQRVKMRKYKEYQDFIHSVLERDDYTCFITKIRGGDLEVHHINGYDWYIDGRVDINNGITLSKEMHKLYHKKYGYKNANKKDFEEFCKIYKV